MTWYLSVGGGEPARDEREDAPGIQRADVFIGELRERGLLCVMSTELAPLLLTPTYR